jgi:hypothetical protein
MTVTAKKLVMIALGLGFGVGGPLLWHQRSQRAAIPQVIVQEREEPAAIRIEPLVMVPPFWIALDPEDRKRLATGAPMSADEAMKGIAVAAPAEKGLGLREGRGRVGRMRPRDASGHIRPASPHKVEETPAAEVVREQQPARAQGVLDPGSLEDTIQRHRSEIRACGEPTPTRGGRRAHGKLALRWIVRPDGRADNVEIRENTVDDPRLTRCVVNSLERWQFDAPEGGPARVSSTFVFSNS